MVTRSVLPRPVWPSKALGSTLPWVLLQEDVEEMLGTTSQYLPLPFQIAWDKVTKNVCCFCLHIKWMEWEAGGI